jgi:hypothetical protein
VAVGNEGSLVSSGQADRYCGIPPAGSSDTARTFGAEVSLGMEGRSLFFVLGRGGAPDAAVRAAGGQVVTRLPDPRRVLAVVPLDAYAGLSRHPAVALAGPISIDANRFGNFAKLVGLDASPQET